MLFIEYRYYNERKNGDTIFFFFFLEKRHTREGRSILNATFVNRQSMCASSANYDPKKTKLYVLKFSM